MSYSAKFNTYELIDKCIKALQQGLDVTNAKLLYKKVKVNIEDGGIATVKNTHMSVLVTGINENLPDIITFFQNRINLTRKTIVDILVQSRTLDLFKENTQKYMDEV